MYNITENLDKNFFNGVPNEKFVNFVQNTYAPIQYKNRGYLLYSDSVVLVKYDGGDVVEVSVCRSDEEEEHVKSSYTKLKWASSGSLPDNAKTVFINTISSRLCRDQKVLNDAKHDEELMSFLFMIGNDTDINWSAYGISNCSTLPDRVRSYFVALGFKCERTFSSSWKNERLLISVNKERIEDIRLYHQLLE